MTTTENPKLAMALMLAATAFIAATTLLAKALGTDALGPALNPLQISHGRFVFALMTLVTAALVMRPKLGRPNLKLHVLRTACGWAGVTMLFAAVAFIPLSDATAISFLNPVFAMLLAIPLLGERVGPVRWGASAIALVGALILLRPGGDGIQPAALIALAAAVAMGLEVIVIKKLATAEAPFQILLVNNAIGLGISSLAVLPVWQPPTPAQWLALAGVGVAMAAAQTLFVNSMARAETSLVVPLTYVTLIFAAFYDLIFFSVWPDFVSVIGATVIISGAALLAWREARRRPL